LPAINHLVSPQRLPASPFAVQFGEDLVPEKFGQIVNVAPISENRSDLPASACDIVRAQTIRAGDIISHIFKSDPVPFVSFSTRARMDLDYFGADDLDKLRQFAVFL